MSAIPELSIPPLFPEPSLQEKSRSFTAAWVITGSIAAIASVWLLMIMAFSSNAQSATKAESPTYQSSVLGDRRPTTPNRQWPEFNKIFTTPAPQLQQQLAHFAQQTPDAVTAISVRAMNSDQEHIAHKDGHVFTAASTTKLITAAAALEMVDRDLIKLTDSLGDSTVEEQLQQLINRSDNKAWDHLNKLVGLQNIQNFANEISLHSFRIDGNKINARDLAVFLQLLYRQELLSPASTELMLQWMTHTNQSTMLPAVFNQADQVYHKYGWLGPVVHDAAIVVHQGQPFVIVVMTDGYEDYQTGQKAIQAAATIVEQALK